MCQTLTYLPSVQRCVSSALKCFKAQWETQWSEQSGKEKKKQMHKRQQIMVALRTHPSNQHGFKSKPQFFTFYVHWSKFSHFSKFHYPHVLVGIEIPTSQDSCNNQEAYKYEEQRPSCSKHWINGHHWLYHRWQSGNSEEAYRLLKIKILPESEVA